MASYALTSLRLRMTPSEAKFYANCGSELAAYDEAITVVESIAAVFRRSISGHPALTARMELRDPYYHPPVIDLTATGINNR